MDVVTNILKAFQDLKDNLKDRISSPVNGAFISIWIIWNWKAVYFFINDEGKTKEKISHIEVYYSDYADLIYGPLCLTFGYLLLFPIFKNIGSMINIFADNTTKALKTKVIEKTSFITQKDKVNIYKIVQEQAEHHLSEVKNYQEKIDSLTILTSQVKLPSTEKISPRALINKRERPRNETPETFELTYINSDIIVKKGLEEGYQIPINERISFNLGDLTPENRKFLVDVYSKKNKNFEIGVLKIPIYYESSNEVMLHGNWESMIFPPTSNLNVVISAWKADFEKQNEAIETRIQKK